MARVAGTIKPISAITNPLPTQKLNIYAFGTGDNAELGLGPEVNAMVFKRPRLNAHLLPDKVGIVAVAIGGMHGLALSYEGKVYSWGANDHYALGRATTHTPLTRVVCSGDDGDNDCDDEVALNPLESTPMLITGFPEGTVIMSIATGDSISITVTDTSRVYGWETFRCADGILRFNERTSVQEVPVLLPTPQSIVRVSIGTDHVLGLTKEGDVYAWGNCQQSQLGRHVSETSPHRADPSPGIPSPAPGQVRCDWLILFFRKYPGWQCLSMGAQSIWAMWDIQTSMLRCRTYSNSRSYHRPASCRVRNRSDIRRRTSLNRPDRER
ncbi:unnamed protein product [Tuber aestivum]|uniref:RCC1-like domain-containing protein n=1 Tax=Tuber aestivum TaxID=59557 RepID=A0A292PRU6_9PEZI|nr:unnamed protein product [Tuber aestivum]